MRFGFWRKLHCEAKHLFSYHLPVFRMCDSERKFDEFTCKSRDTVGKSGLHRQATNENSGDKRPWIPNIPRRRLDEMYFTNRDISIYPYKRISCKYNSKVSPFCCSLLAVFVCIAWVGANSESTDNLYRFVVESEQIRILISRLNSTEERKISPVYHELLYHRECATKCVN